MLQRYTPNQFFLQFSLGLTPQCHSSQIAKTSPMQLRAMTELTHVPKNVTLTFALVEVISAN